MVEDQRRRYDIAAAASRPIVADALRQIRAIAAKAERRFSITPHTYDAEAICRAEAETLRGFDVPEERALKNAPPGGDPLAHGIPVTGPKVQLVEPSAPPSRRHPESEPPSAAPPADGDGRDEDDSDWAMETLDA